MSNPLEKDFESIEAYLDGSLSIAERNAFEERLKTDQEFREEFEALRLSYQAIILQSRKELKEQLKALEKNKLTEAKTINWKYLSLGVAASLSLAILVINLLSSPSTEDLYDTYYSTYPNVVAPIERNESVDDPYKKAFQLYEKGSYEIALNQFKILLTLNPDLPELNLYAGLSALALKDPSSAILYFENVSKISTNDYTDTALWYSALAYLQKDDKSNAISKLKKLKQSNFYRERVERLLDKLK